MNEEKKDLTLEGNDDELLPDGWADGDDIFDMKSWTGGGDQADASGAETGAEDTEAGDDFTLEKFLTNGTEEADEGSAGNTEEATTTGNTEEEKPRAKLKFGVTIDHNQQDVELDESELPTLYQKAYATDRAQAKLAKISPVYEKSERMAKMLGYDTVDAMLDAAEKSYTDSEVERLTSENVHPEVARDMVNRRIHERETAPAEQRDEGQPAAEEKPAGRDFKAEVAEMLRAFPKLRGQKLPQEVIDDCVKNGKPLVQAYVAYKEKADEAEKTALRKEKDTLKQNADAAARAPVRGVSKGGATDTKPGDPFLDGFNSDEGWKR